MASQTRPPRKQQQLVEQDPLEQEQEQRQPEPPSARGPSAAIANKPLSTGHTRSTSTVTKPVITTTTVTKPTASNKNGSEPKTKPGAPAQNGARAQEKEFKTAAAAAKVSKTSSPTVSLHDLDEPKFIDNPPIGIKYCIEAAKGQGLFASEKIGALTVFMSDKSILSIGPDDADQKLFMQWDRRFGIAMTKKLVKTCGSATAALEFLRPFEFHKKVPNHPYLAVMLKSNCTVEGEVARILEQYLWGYSTFMAMEQLPLAGLFPVAGLINHSCEPNAILLSDDRMAHILSLREIKMGEEITVSYVRGMGILGFRQKCYQQLLTHMVDQVTTFGTLGARCDCKAPTCIMHITKKEREAPPRQEEDDWKETDQWLASCIYAASMPNVPTATFLNKVGILVAASHLQRLIAYVNDRSWSGMLASINQLRAATKWSPLTLESFQNALLRWCEVLLPHMYGTEDYVRIYCFMFLLRPIKPTKWLQLAAPFIHSYIQSL